MMKLVAAVLILCCTIEYFLDAHPPPIVDLNIPDDDLVKRITDDIHLLTSADHDRCAYNCIQWTVGDVVGLTHSATSIQDFLAGVCRGYSQGVHCLHSESCRVHEDDVSTILELAKPLKFVCEDYYQGTAHELLRHCGSMKQFAVPISAFLENQQCLFPEGGTPMCSSGKCDGLDPQGSFQNSVHLIQRMIFHPEEFFGFKNHVSDACKYAL